MKIKLLSFFLILGSLLRTCLNCNAGLKIHRVDGDSTVKKMNISRRKPNSPATKSFEESPPKQINSLLTTKHGGMNVSIDEPNENLRKIKSSNDGSSLNQSSVTKSQRSNIDTSFAEKDNKMKDTSKGSTKKDKPSSDTGERVYKDQA
uniref:Uncharacterized protein n=1 Tax=Ananas comosus var. bracteatus TaxID=296719 RepID=A0A6V7PTP0_ANACO|nr:unnamed protein product [Ananas comosus var. bracteatus]